MKTIKIRNPVLLVIFAATIILSLHSCAKKVYFPTSSVVPAARGYVKVKKDKIKIIR